MPADPPTMRPPTPGERWTRDQLSRLLETRCSPHGVSDFLRASFARSGEIRAARPELAGQARGWLACGALLWVALAAARVTPFRRAAPAGLLWWSATALMLDWHLGMLETEDGQPRPLGLADALTLGRAWLVPVAFTSPGPLVCAAGAATDALDGLAARGGEPTRAGRDLEGLVDCCFAAATLCGLRRAERIGRGPARAELLRLGCGLGHSAFHYFARAAPPDRELVRAARASTALRAAGLLLAASGRRRLADVALATGSGASLGLLVRAVLAR